MREIYIPPKKATTRYGCDFCKKTTARKETMERHEPVCYYNPDRICPICDGSGRLEEWSDDGYYKISDDECYPCKVAKEAQTERTTLELT
jgi:hypothetical protein